LKRLVCFFIFIYLLAVGVWAQTVTPTIPVPTPTPTATPSIPLLLPVPSPTDFVTNFKNYQAWKFNPSPTPQWTILPNVVYQTTGNAVGVIVPVSTFNGQYALATNKVPTSDFFNLPAGEVECGAYASFGISPNPANPTAPKTLQINVFNGSGEKTSASFSVNLAPGSYTWQINKSSMGLSTGTYFLQVIINGNLIITSETIVVGLGC
jgi:hypothetical protein